MWTRTRSHRKNTSDQQDLMNGLVSASEDTPSSPLADSSTRGNQEGAAAPAQFDNHINAIKGGALLEAIRPRFEKYVEDASIVRPALETAMKALMTPFPSAARLALWDAACRPLIDVEELRVVISADPEGAKVADKFGKLPIHYVAEHSRSGEAVQIWVDAYPHGVTCLDAEGYLPLHIAVKNGNSVDVLQILITAHPEGIICKNKNGSLPLHCVSDNVDVVKMLLAAFPEGVTCKNKFGNLPLHCAATVHSKSVEVVKTLIAVYPEGISCKNKDGRLPLHCAVLSDGVDVVQTLLAAYPESIRCADEHGCLPLHIAVYSTNVDVLKIIIDAHPEAITVKDKHDCLPLHHAAIYCKSVDMVQAILAAYPEGITCKDKDGRLPLHYAAYSNSIGVVQLVIAAHPEGVRSVDNFGLLPIQMSQARKEPEAAVPLFFLDNNPEFADKWRKVQCPYLKELWRAYCRAFTPTMSDVSNFHIHICGEPNAGKSVVFHWTSQILKQNRSVVSRVGDFVGLNPTSHSITPDDRRATRGMITETVPYTTKAGRSLHCILHDYGAQAQFKLTHPQHLSCPASIYVIVLPLYSMEAGAWYTISELRAHMVEWLRMIYSVKHVSMHEHHDGNSAQQVPVLVVVNTFSTVRTPNKKQINLSCVHNLIADMRLYFTDKSSMVKELFHFLDPVLINARAKGDAYSLEPPLITASEMVCGSQMYSRYHCVEFLLTQLPAWPSLLMTKEEVLLEIAAVFKKHNYQGFTTMRSSQGDISAYLADEQSNRRLAEFSFKVMVEMRHLLVLNSIPEQARSIVTNPNVLTNKVVGEVLHGACNNSIEGIHCAVPLVHTSAELDKMVPDLPAGITVAMVLESLGLAKPVTVTKTNEIIEILPAPPAGSNVMYLMGLVSENIPEDVKQACQQEFFPDSTPVFITLQKFASPVGVTVVRSVSRLFTPQNNRYSFIPGFYVGLFTFIHNQNSYPDRCWYWKDGMVMKSRSRHTGENGMPFESIKEILLYPFNAHGVEGFVVKITLWVDSAALVQSSMVNWEGFFHPKDIVLDDIYTIRDFIMSKEHWKISVDEYVLREGSNVPYPLPDAEMDWFACEASRMSIRPSLIGYFFKYNWFIGAEMKLALSLSKGSDIEQSFCEWSGAVNKLVDILLSLDIADEDLKLWIIRYYRCRSLRLSVEECDGIIHKVLTVNNVALIEGDATEMDQSTTVPPAVEIEQGSDLRQRSQDVTAPQCQSTKPTQSAENQQVIQTLDHQGQILQQILLGQQTAHKLQVEKDRSIQTYPLLAVMCKYKGTTHAGNVKAFAGGFLGISTYSVHFHCSACRCQSSTSGTGYMLQLGSNTTKKVLKAFHLSLSVLQLMLQLGGVPNQVSAIADFAINSLDILATDLRDELLKVAEVQEIADLHKSFVDVKRSVGQHALSGTSTNPQRRCVLSSTKTAVEKVVTRQQIDAVEHLFKVCFQDPKARNSGLEKAIRDNGEAAWVCGPAEDGTKSFCYQEFMEKGQDVIGVLLKYV